MAILSPRPLTPATTDCADIQNFISFLKGDQNVKCDFSLPDSLNRFISDKIKTLSPIKAISNVAITSGDRFDIIKDNDENESSGWITNEILKSDDSVSASKISIYLHELFAKPKVSSSLLDDHSAKVEDFINEKITTQMASAENKAFLYGNGKFQPKGILSYDISIGQNEKGKIEGLVAGEPGKIESYQSLIDLMELLPTKYLSNAYWIMSRNAASYIRTMKDESSGKFIWQNSIAHGIPDALLGYPVVICDDMPKLETKKEMCVPVLFANLVNDFFSGGYV